MSLRTENVGRWERLVQSFLTGVVGMLPLGLTVIVLAWIVTLLHDLAGPSSLCGKVFRSVGMSVVACEVTAYLIGLTGALLLVYLVGVMIERGAGKHWSRTMEHALERIPVLGTVYDASKQVTSVFDRKPGDKQNMTPVICYFGEGRTAWTPALMPTTEYVRLDGIDYHVVMIPTAPVPFGGALLCVKAEWVKPAHCGIEELVGIYMSMGVTAPRSLGSSDGDPSEPNPTSPGGS
jgi:uncharacterized membrane protein